MDLEARFAKIQKIGDKFIATYTKLTGEEILALPSQEKNFIYSMLRDVGYFTDPIKEKARIAAEARAKADAEAAAKAREEDKKPQFGEGKLDSTALPFPSATG